MSQIHEVLIVPNLPFSNIHSFDTGPLSPFLRLCNLFVHVKGGLNAFTFKNVTTDGDEKVEKFDVDGQDVEVIVRWIKMKNVGE